MWGERAWAFWAGLAITAGCSGTQSIRDEPSNASVTIEIHNARADAIHLVVQSECRAFPYAILSPGREELAIDPAQSFSCSMTQGTIECDDVGDCGAPPTLRLDAGERWTGGWDGRAFERRRLEAQAPNCPDECIVWERQPHGRYTVTARAHRRCPDDDCSGAGPPDLEATASVQLGADRTAVLRFDRAVP